jgi:hypothetical protein
LFDKISILAKEMLYQLALASTDRHKCLEHKGCRPSRSFKRRKAVDADLRRQDEGEHLPTFVGMTRWSRLACQCLGGLVLSGASCPFQYEVARSIEGVSFRCVRPRFGS